MDIRTGELYLRDGDGRLLRDNYATDEDRDAAERRMLEAERAGTLVDLEQRVDRLLAKVQEEAVTIA